MTERAACTTRVTLSVGQFRWTWDLSVTTLFIFQSILILHANTSMIALQCSYTYPFSILTQRPIVCAPVPLSHPCLLHPHVDSCPSYRCFPASVLIAYMPLHPCGSILYK